VKEGKVILTVTGQRVIATFDKRQGSGRTTLYEVNAVDQHGQPVEEALRAFTELPIGKAMEFEVSRYDHPRHGISWTVQKPRENTAQRVADLEDRVKDIEDRLGAVERRGNGSPSALDRS